jgi:ribosomally synthesized peptide (two-chain TOMM family)
MALNNAVPSFESMLEFQEVYLRAIAFSWEDAEFKGALLKNPLEALGRYFHYTCPWLIDLKVVEAPEGAGWDAGKQSWSLPNNVMSFGVPVRPSAGSEEAIALAAYNDAGPAYLFTCC